MYFEVDIVPYKQLSSMNSHFGESPYFYYHIKVQITSYREDCN